MHRTSEADASLTIDHVPFAWRDLNEITRVFEGFGLTPEYGGVHDNGVTHMSVLGFSDHSYVELIAERSEGDHDFWPDHIRANAGPAAWCVRVDDVVAECERMLHAGVPVNGPLYGSRERDDGTLVEWDRAEFGTDAQRLLLPFAIEDRTPLRYRVSPSPSVVDGPLSGIGQVVVAVQNLDRAVELFRRVYRLPKPVRGDVSGFGPVASFPGEPLALAGAGGADWITDRLDQFPECPCSLLLATDDLNATRETYPLGDAVSWPDGHGAFFDSETLGYRLGVVERT